MENETVFHACRLLHEALSDDLELVRLSVHIELGRVLLTVHPKRPERRVVIGEESATENVRLLDDWR